MESARGCYLTFDHASQGTLFVHWSETAVAGALAFFAPRKAVPAFKFKAAGGRAELIREMSGGTGDRIRRYYSGWCQFIKLAKTFQADVVVLDFGELPRVTICLFDGSKPADNIYEVERNVPVTLEPYVVVATVPYPNPCFGATTMGKEYFAQVGNREGSSSTM
ncbi:hypothetical protein M885DRAFT_535211 [Pelagophyceae sp. CCMP2097]|nr:hypothetical protein M885DRAFT_535211 [Pelagophyceae sp. CCMP2097]